MFCPITSNWYSQSNLVQPRTLATVDNIRAMKTGVQPHFALNSCIDSCDIRQTVDGYHRGSEGVIMMNYHMNSTQFSVRIGSHMPII